MASETPFSQLPCVWWHIVIDNAVPALQREQQKNHLYEHSRRRGTYTSTVQTTPRSLLSLCCSTHHHGCFHWEREVKIVLLLTEEPKMAMADATAAPAAASKPATAQCPSQRGRCRRHWTKFLVWVIYARACFTCLLFAGLCDRFGKKIKKKKTLKTLLWTLDRKKGYFSKCMTWLPLSCLKMIYHKHKEGYFKLNTKTAKTHLC